MPLSRTADFAAQQAAWWSTVLLVRADHPRLALLSTLAVVVGHVWLAKGGRARRLFVAAVAALVGFTADTGLLVLGAITFEADAVVPPLWMTGLWAAFGVAFFVSLAWVRRLGALAQLGAGGIAGLVAYHAGASLGVLGVTPGVRANVAVAVAWAAAVLAIATLTDFVGEAEER